VQEPQNPPSADVDIPDTEVIVVAHPSPVFVDTTGRRSRMLRRVAYGFGALCMVYGGLVSVSLAGGPVSSSAVLPLPDLADDDEEEDAVVARPRPIPEPVTTTRASQPVLEVFPRRGVPVTRPQQARAVTPRTTSASPRPARTPSSTPTKKPTSASPKPVESASTKPTSPGTTTPTTEPPTPVPPVPPQIPSGDSGGQGGGAQSGGAQNGGGSADEEPATRAPAEPKPVPPAPPAVGTAPASASASASAEPTGKSGPGDGS
jgi:hypothetical protein